MTRKELPVTIMVLTLLLTACNQPAVSPTTVSAEAPTVAPTEAPAPTPRLPSTSTTPPGPTEVPEPTISPTPTETPSATATVMPIKIAGTPTATPVLTEMELRTWSSTSPDGKWSAQGKVAFPVSGGENYYTQLKVEKTDGTVEWTVVDEWSRIGLGYTTPQPFHWSRDGRYLYFTNRPVPDGCGVFVNGSDLHRVDLSNGSVAEIVPHSGLWLSLSPDETVLAYVGYRDRGLVLHDLTTGAERETKLNPGQDYTAGHIIWAPDGTALVFTLAIRPCSTNWAETTSVVRAEISSLRQATLIHEDKRLFITVEWPTLDKVLLQDDSGDLWWMNSETGLVTKKE